MQESSNTMESCFHWELRALHIRRIFFYCKVFYLRSWQSLGGS
jgi:hypothetical protein